MNGPGTSKCFGENTRCPQTVGAVGVMCWIIVCGNQWHGVRPAISPDVYLLRIQRRVPSRLPIRPNAISASAMKFPMRRVTAPHVFVAWLLLPSTCLLCGRVWRGYMRASAKNSVLVRRFRRVIRVQNKKQNTHTRKRSDFTLLSCARASGAIRHHI